MKTSLLIIASLLILDASAQTGSFSITGDVTSIKDKITMVHYRYMVYGISVDDSAVVKNGYYTMKGKLDEHVMLQSSAVYADASMKHDYMRDYNTIHIIPGINATVKHTEKFSNAEVKGSAAHDEYMQLHPRLVKGDTEFLPEYIRSNPESPMQVWLLRQFIIGPWLNAATHEPMYNMLSEKNKNTPSGKLLKEHIEIDKRTAIGKMAPDISQKDSMGKVISLSDFKGKYLLVEFWASWCSPCRRENPNLVKTYQKYKDSGFEIFGISVDESRKSWLRAIAKDGLTWVNAADMLEMETNPAAKAYGITGVPHNYLIDPKGKIIARDLKGDALDKKLSELFN